MLSTASTFNATQCSVCSLPLAEFFCPPSQQHSCPFCRKGFARADAARRHAKTCPHKGNQSLPPASKRGRKLRACDQCSQVKVSCDAKVPCGRCASRRQTCTYKWLCSDPSHRQAHKPSAESRRIPLSFLVNLTDPSKDFVTEEQVAREPESIVEGPAARSASPSTHDPPEFIDPTLLFSGLLDPLLTISFDNDQIQGELGPFSQASPDDQLASRVQSLTAELRDFAATEIKYENTFDCFAFAELFSSANVHRFARAFCRKRHYQFPVIHWPTFDLGTASLPLLLAVALTGAAYSHRPGHHVDYASQARGFYVLSNAYIFKRLGECAGSSEAGSNCSSRSSHHIELCQAAILSYLLGTCMNDDGVRHILVTASLPALVDAVRRFRSVGTHHEPFEDWCTFVERESHIRLATWTFYVDNVTTLFCNNPPVMALPEMTGHLPCTPELWDADSSEAFDEVREKEDRGIGISCLRDAITNLFAEVWPRPESAPYRHLHFSHLNAMVLALQPIVYNSHVTLLPDSSTSIFLRALSRWKRLWDATMLLMSAEQRRWMGVASLAPEVAWLTQKIVELNRTKSGEGFKYLQRIPGYNLVAIHELIQELQSG